jgi:hypothetical protein
MDQGMLSPLAQVEEHAQNASHDSSDDDEDGMVIELSPAQKHMKETTDAFVKAVEDCPNIKKDNREVVAKYMICVGSMISSDHVEAFISLLPNSSLATGQGATANRLIKALQVDEALPKELVITWKKVRQGAKTRRVLWSAVETYFGSGLNAGKRSVLLKSMAIDLKRPAPTRASFGKEGGDVSELRHFFSLTVIITFHISYFSRI